MTNEEKLEQLALQCRVVAYLAKQIEVTHNDLAVIYSEDYRGEVNEITGRLTAERMEILGDILNGMDAVMAEDEWVNPVFEKARQLWPPSSVQKDKG